LKAKKARRLLSTESEKYEKQAKDLREKANKLKVKKKKLEKDAATVGT